MIYLRNLDLIGYLMTGRLLSIAKNNLQWVYSYMRWVLSVCHKNKWLDLWWKLVTSLIFVFWRRTRKHSYWRKKYFRPIRMFSCPPLKSKRKTNKFTLQIMSLIFEQTKDLFIKNRTRTVLKLLLFWFDFLWISLYNT